MTILLPLLLLAAAGSPAANNAVVLEPVANLHSKPNADADVVTQAIYAANVLTIAAQGEWVRVETPDRYRGWIARNALRARPPYAAAGPVAQVESLFASVYREKDVARHRPLLTVPFETRFEVAGAPDAARDRWLAVKLPDGRAGWIQKGDVTLAPRAHSIAETIAFSKRFLGLPYLWGGTSAFGYDCSGFTQMLCRRRGYFPPRDADLQAAWSGMKPVRRADLEPGDLLYFGASAARITHTGMYLGAGEFINATLYSRPAVQICKLDDEHWTKLLVAARRLK